MVGDEATDRVGGGYVALSLTRIGEGEEGFGGMAPGLSARVMGLRDPEPGDVMALVEAGGASVVGLCRGPADAPGTTIPAGRVAAVARREGDRLLLVDRGSGEALLEDLRDGACRPVGNVLAIYGLERAVDGLGPTEEAPFDLVTDDPLAAELVGGALGLGEGAIAELRRLGGPVAMTRGEVVDAIVALVDEAARARRAREVGGEVVEWWDPPRTVRDVLHALRPRGPEMPSVPTIEDEPGATPG